MLFEMLFAAGAASSPPRFATGITAAEQTAGACYIPDPNKPLIAQTQYPAVVRLSWNIVLPNADYELRVFKDGVLLVTLDTTARFYDYTVDGLVRNASVDPQTVAWVFSAEIVRKSGGAVYQSSTAPTWNATYGNCAPGDVP